MLIKMGQKVPMSGQYRPIGTTTELTFIENNIVPPTRSGIIRIRLVDKIKHKGDN